MHRQTNAVAREGALDNVCPVGYTLIVKYSLASTRYFEKWFRSLKDRVTKQKILARLARVENGHFGDYRQIESNLYELRFFFGGGLRVYYTIRKEQVVLLLVGGDKSSQESDIDKAKRLLNELE